MYLNKCNTSWCGAVGVLVLSQAHEFAFLPHIHTKTDGEKLDARRHTRLQACGAHLTAKFIGYINLVGKE